MALKARHIPFAMKTKMEAELDRLLKLGHIEKVEVSEWATPIVPVPKGNGVLICRDFKLTVNLCIVIDKYPLLLIDEIFSALQAGQTFSQIDLSYAYMQTAVVEKSRKILTVVMHKGLFRYRKIPERVVSGPGDFQRKMEATFCGIPNTAVYLNNVYCTGKTHEEHVKILEQVFSRLRRSGLKVNVSKCEFFKKKIQLLGFLLLINWGCTRLHLK